MNEIWNDVKEAVVQNKAVVGIVVGVIVLLCIVL